jgi:hypothetical protein
MERARRGSAAARTSGAAGIAWYQSSTSTVKAWRTAPGQDLSPRFNGLAKWAQYMAYLRRPNGYLSPKGNFGYTGLYADKDAGTLGCLVAARYGDPLGVTHRLHGGRITQMSDA